MNTYKILLVDDSETVLMMEKMILKKERFSFIEAKNGQEAVDKAVTEKPNLILLDIMMPVMNGIEACKNIRANDVTREIPIIMVTTRGEEENVKLAFQNGCDDYVTKPINSTELLTKIRQCLSK
ncbi:response regulator [bacterium]|nr:response regulator [bacterium]